MEWDGEEAVVLQTVREEWGEVALKLLQPVEPGPGARSSAVAAYKAAAAKWEREPEQYACRAYCTARQELSVLRALRHSHIVPLIGLCPRPLALAVALAPLGALNAILKDFRRSGARLPRLTLRDTALQVARALEYLHQEHIIYRSLSLSSPPSPSFIDGARPI